MIDFLKPLLLVSAIFLYGCSSMPINSMKETTPRFILEDHFEGRHTGHGAFFQRLKNQPKEFRIELLGLRKSDKEFVLKEKLYWKDGKIETRDYTFTKLSEHKYKVEASGLRGPGYIESYGNALQWSYNLEVHTKNRTWVLGFDDWMFLQDSGVVLNRARAYKFGFEVGEVIMTIHKSPEGTSTEL